MDAVRIHRRLFGRYSGLSLLGASMSGWLPRLALQAESRGIRPARSCILLWMSGGPSQIDTFDPHEGHANGGPVKAIETSVPGIRIADSLPRTAQVMQHLAPIRTMSTKEGDHARATYYLRTGYLPQGPVQFPTLGSLLSHQLRQDECELPAFISVNPFRTFSPEAFGPGFLGPAWSPLVVADQRSSNTDISFEVRNLQTAPRLAAARIDDRIRLLNVLEQEFLAERPGIPGSSHRQSYAQAVRMMRSRDVGAFRLDDEPNALRDRYGRNPFGQACLLARRLVEKGVAFVEVALNGLENRGGAGWDSHTDNFQTVRDLCEVLDPAWATLMSDLQERGLLESTLVVWMGEFGRTPVINENAGRDHWPGSWSAVLGGGGIRTGQVCGRTSSDGMEIEESPVSVPNLMATICRAVGLDETSSNQSNIGRPIPLADHGAVPLQQLLT